MGARNYGVGADMRLAFSFMILFALAVFAKPSVKLPLPKELQGEELPWFAFDAKDENTINRDNLKELVKQKKYRRVVFSFFATWCIPCREGLKRMSDNAEALRKRGVLVVLVNVAERDLDNYSRKKIDGWVRQNGYLKDEWLLVFDRFSNSLEDFGLRNGSEEAPLPRSLVVDGDLRPLLLVGEEGDDFFTSMP